MSTEPTKYADHPPKLSAQLYLWDQSQPTFRVYRGTKPHVTIDIGELGIAAFTPETLRRLAHTCLDAADALEDELAEREVPKPAGGRRPLQGAPA